MENILGLICYANSFEAIFICFGALTIAVSIMVLLFLPDTPANARFLTKEERAQAVARVEANMTGIKNDKWKREQVMEALCDPNAWLLAVSYLAAIIPNNGLLTVSRALVPLCITTHSFTVQHHCYPGSWLLSPKDTPSQYPAICLSAGLCSHICYWKHLSPKHSADVYGFQCHC